MLAGMFAWADGPLEPQSLDGSLAPVRQHTVGRGKPGDATRRVRSASVRAACDFASRHEIIGPSDWLSRYSDHKVVPALILRAVFITSRPVILAIDADTQ